MFAKQKKLIYCDVNYNGVTARSISRARGGGGGQNFPLSRIMDIYAKSFEAILAQSRRFLDDGGRSFFYLFITKSRLDYAICFVQSGNTTATHGNALPFPRFPRAYKAADEISSKEFSGEFARVVKNANARKQKKKGGRGSPGGGEGCPRGGKRKTGEIV